MRWPWAGDPRGALARLATSNASSARDRGRRRGTGPMPSGSPASAFRCTSSRRRPHSPGWRPASRCSSSPRTGLRARRRGRRREPGRQARTRTCGPRGPSADRDRPRELVARPVVLHDRRSLPPERRSDDRVAYLRLLAGGRPRRGADRLRRALPLPLCARTVAARDVGVPRSRWASGARDRLRRSRSRPLRSSRSPSPSAPASALLAASPVVAHVDPLPQYPPPVDPRRAVARARMVALPARDRGGGGRGAASALTRAVRARRGTARCLTRSQPSSPSRRATTRSPASSRRSTPSTRSSRRRDDRTRRCLRQRQVDAAAPARRARAAVGRARRRRRGRPGAPQPQGAAALPA